MRTRELENMLAREAIKKAWPQRHDPFRGVRARCDLHYYLNLLQSHKWEEHSHKCGHTDRTETSITGLRPIDGCGHVWSHDSKSIESDEQNFDEHTCPKCGKGPWYLKYRALPNAA